MQPSRRTLLLVLGAVVVLAAGIGAALAVWSGGGSTTTTAAVASTAARSSLLAGIPQQGVVLGDPSAPELAEFVDLQCPYCGELSRVILPTVVREYVRTGKVKLVFRGLAFLGPDSTTALRAVESAGLQNRLWDVLEQLFARQGAENSGWVTEGLLRDVGGAVPGLDVGRWLADAGSTTVASRIAEAQAAATAAGVRGTPTFVLRGRQLQLQALSPAAFRAAIDPLLGT